MKWLSIILTISMCNTLEGAAPPLQKCDSGGINGSTAFSCSMVSSVTIGNLVVQVLFVQSTTITISSFSGSNTWHTIGPIKGSNNEAFIVWTVVTSAQASLQVNMSASAIGDTGAGEYTNMAGVGTVADCNSAGASGNSAALTSGSCTPTASNDLLVAVGGIMANSTTFSGLGGYTSEESDAHSTLGDSYIYMDNNDVNCNAKTASATASNTGQWSMIMAAFKTSSPGSCSSTVYPSILGSHIGGFIH